MRLAILCAVATAALAVSAGCKVDRTIACAGPDDCVRAGVQGQCLVPGYCAFFDDECTGGRRWDQTAGDGLADACVDEGDVDPADRNSCGGIVVLGAAVGDDCGLCNRGQFQCDGTDALMCIDEPSVEEAGVAVQYSASSVFDGDFANYGPANAIDGVRATSWFADGGDTASFGWKAGAEECITRLEIIGNALHPEFSQNTGFARVTVEVVNGAGETVFSEDHDLPGSPDPDLAVDVDREGIEIRLDFGGAESSEHSGFAELFVTVVR